MDGINLGKAHMIIVMIMIWSTTLVIGGGTNEDIDDDDRESWPAAFRLFLSENSSLYKEVPYADSQRICKTIVKELKPETYEKKEMLLEICIKTYLRPYCDKHCQKELKAKEKYGMSDEGGKKLHTSCVHICLYYGLPFTPKLKGKNENSFKPIKTIDGNNTLT